VLLDIGLPRLNGYEAGRRIRAQRHDKPLTLVALTGWGQETDRQQSKEAGFDFHFVKPVDPVILGKVLDHATASRDASPAD
jgi:CheY-like chemotaxis protein